MWKDDAYLLDILLAAKDAREFTAGLSFDDFQHSRLHQSIVHDYGNVSQQLIWQVAQEELPRLIDRISALIPPENQE
jgi:uncharacterized protein with HEPN domain